MFFVFVSFGKDKGSFIDGEIASSLKPEDIDYNTCDFFMVKIGIKEDAEFCGGVNIFGSTYGNYEQDIIFKVGLDK